MKNFVLLLSFTFLFFNHQSFSQIDKNILVKAHDKYYYQNRVYKKKELGELFKIDTQSFKYYQRHRRASKIFKASGLSTLFLASGGLILFNIDGPGNQSEGDKCYEFCPHQGVGIYMILASFLPATAALISLPISRVSFKKSIKSFKIYTETAPNMGSLPIEMNINYTGNGIGLVFNF